MPHCTNNSGNLKDLQVIAEVLSGNKQAYAFIIQKYQQKLFNIALRITHNQEDALDVTQESFLNAYHNLNKFDINRSFLPWLIKITTNNALQNLRKRKSTADIDNYKHLLCKHENHDKKIFLEKILNSLPYDYKIIIELKHYQEYSYADIAKELNISEAAVKSRLFRARKYLQDEIRRNDEL